MGHNLAQRAEQAREQTAERPLTLADQIQTMTGRIMQHEQDFQAAMPKGVEAAQLIRDAMTCLRGTPQLAQCYAPTVLGGLMTCAQLGLRPGVAGLGHAWLIPFKNFRQDNRLDAQLIIGYRGYVELAYRHDRVLAIASRIVYERDHFRIGYRLDGDILEHDPYVDGPRGDIRSFYAMARLKGDEYALTEPMSRAEMEEHRDKYAMAKRYDKETKRRELAGPWADPAQFPEMGRKTMIRARLVKMIPLSTELAMAVAVDEGVRVDITPTVVPTDATETAVIGGELAPDDDTAAIEPAGAVEWPEVAKPGSGRIGGGR
ncbi:recombinase RecT [Nonomuraea sp. NBC_01738]|uniref:recombinase RecT n=1 Tax=Nonomuraea sp. NBC_01738 TaxID=2976003 RepID=UPI002E0DD422|nr:recombinase RecT [Nonomuraea sp. NBC_01738]